MRQPRASWSGLRQDPVMQQPHARSLAGSPVRRDSRSSSAMASAARASLAFALLIVACHGKQEAEPPHATPVEKQPKEQPVAEAIHQPAWLGVRFEPGTTRVVQVVADSP